MTLRFEIFWRETANWQRRKTGKFGQGIYTIVQNLVTLQVCIGHSGLYRGHYGDVKGRLFSVISHWCHSCQRDMMAIIQALT